MYYDIVAESYRERRAAERQERDARETVLEEPGRSRNDQENTKCPVAK